MNFIKNCLSKYHIKRILVPLLLAAIVATIVLEMGVLLSWQKPSFNLASMDILKISTPDPLEPSQECLGQYADGNGVPWSCFASYFERITNEVSVSAAMAEAKRFKEQSMMPDCHLFAHFIGEEALEKDDFDIDKAFSGCVAGCNSGCFHGVIERHIHNVADLSDISSTMKNLCVRLGTDPLREYRCIHGVGHGLFAHEYLSLRDALTTCEAMSSGEKEREDTCIGGMMMENAYQYLELDLDEDTLIKFIPRMCAEVTSVEPDIIDLCLYDVALGLMDYTGFDVERTEELCEELQLQEHINICKNYIPEVLESEQPSIGM